MESEYRKAINRVTHYINQHLDETLHLEKLASRAGFSPFHFNRIFAAFVGEPPGAYIRRLRLNRAAYQLLESRLQITFIALEAGFETPAAFTRAFRRQFGLSPSRYRGRRWANVPLTSPDHISSYGKNRRTNMNPVRFETLPDQRILTVTRTGLIDKNFNKASDEAFKVLVDYINLKRMWHQVGTCLGITPDDATPTPDEKARYMAGFILTGEARLESSGEVRIEVLPAGRFAVFLHKGPYETMWQTWHAIYHDWLPESGETPRDCPPYEVYLNDKRKVAASDLRTEIFIPIQ